MLIKEVVINKLTSGRFWLVILFGITICYLAKVEPSIRDAFMALAGGVIRDYFGRGDRPKENNGNEQGKTGPGESAESPKQP